MADAKRDSNFHRTLIGVSSVDQTTPTLVEIDPVTGRVLVQNDPAASLSAVAIADQVKITAAAQQGPIHELTNGVIVTALSTNAGNVFIGSDNTVDTTADGTGDGYILEAGASVSFAVDNTNDLWFIGTADDVVSLAGS